MMAVEIAPHRHPLLFCLQSALVVRV